MQEIFVDIAGWEGYYQISNLGRVRSVRYDCIMMKLQLHSQGYLQVHLKRGAGTRIKRFVHRLVAEAFLPNPRELPMVDHNDTNRSNNALSNLMWATYSENNWYRAQPVLREKTANADMAF